MLHVKRKDNVLADILSRILCKPKGEKGINMMNTIKARYKSEENEKYVS